VRQRLVQALHPAPGRDLWRERAGLSPMQWRLVSDQVERLVAEREGAYDVLLQFYCVFAPGRLDVSRRFGLYLDCTMALTRRLYWRSAPISPYAERRWIALEREVYRKAEHLFPMSDWVRRSLIDDYGVDDARITVVGAGTNLVGAALPEARAEQPVALFVGLDWRRKGGPQLLEAWKAVRRAIPDAELWIVGTRKAYGEEGEHGVRWFGRIADKARLTEIYAAATVFALPSLFDPFPHVLREALGQGVPCVAARVGAVEEIVRDGEDSILVEPDDVPALAAGLTALLGDRDRAAAMGRAGHERMLGAVTWEHVAERMTPGLVAAGRGS
jgi:glycosyltransferase involved in cell wall biosynthesis